MVGTFPSSTRYIVPGARVCRRLRRLPMGRPARPERKAVARKTADELTKHQTVDRLRDLRQKALELAGAEQARLAELETEAA